MTTIIFLKAIDKRDSHTVDMFGTHTETHTRRDGVVQTYHVNSPVPKFDPAAWDKARAERVAASRATGAVHLDKLPYGVESLRGKKLSYVHKEERGTITTVDNRGRIYVRWESGPHAGHEAAITRDDAKDYVVTNPSEAYDPVAWGKERRKLKMAEERAKKKGELSKPLVKAIIFLR